MARKRYSPEQIIGYLREAKVLIENWRKEYNQFRPHSSLNYQPPAPETINPKVVQLTGAGQKSLAVKLRLRRPTSYS